MAKWVKYWVPGISIVAMILSIISLFKVEYIILSESWLSWAIGISVTLTSIGVVIVLGYQIYNSTTLDKRMKEMFEERTEKVRESLAISNARSIAAVLYQAEGSNLKLSVALDDFVSAIKSLNSRLEYAISLNEVERISEIAGIIVNTRTIFLQKRSYKGSWDNSFLKLAQVALTHLSASDVQVPRLFEMINQIQSDKSNTSQNQK